MSDDHNSINILSNRVCDYSSGQFDDLIAKSILSDVDQLLDQDDDRDYFQPFQFYKIDNVSLINDAKISGHNYLNSYDCNFEKLVSIIKNGELDETCEEIKEIICSSNATAEDIANNLISTYQIYCDNKEMKKSDTIIRSLVESGLGERSMRKLFHIGSYRFLRMKNKKDDDSSKKSYLRGGGSQVSEMDQINLINHLESISSLDGQIEMVIIIRYYYHYNNYSMNRNLDRGLKYMNLMYLL